MVCEDSRFIWKTKMDNEAANEFRQHHKDGSLWAKGQVIGNTPLGYWEWFRTDGTRMRSGSFRDGLQVGAWTTYDKTGAVYKVTNMKDGKKGGPKATIEPAK